MASYYIVFGIVLALLSGVSLLVFMGILLLQGGNKKPVYYQKLPRKEHPAEFFPAVLAAYDATGDIKGMLVLLRNHWKKGITGKRVAAALDYLEHSRYRDYETTLRYLSDQSKDCESLLMNILEQEIRKQRGLICKN